MTSVVTYTRVCIALTFAVLLVGSGATAAALIDSSDLANGTVKARDLSDNSVGSSQVIDGSQRPRDVHGTVQYALNAGHMSFTAAGPQLPSGDLASSFPLQFLPLPAGSFVVTGTINLTTTGSNIRCVTNNQQENICAYVNHDVVCSLTAGDRVVRADTYMRGAFPDSVLVPLAMKVDTPTGVSVELRCSESADSRGVTARDIRMHAVRIHP